ncbi:MAG TPA: TonB-dependent receptor plug domain-containing protein [Puia sp.]|nr:TonB-dependent receptor plug domain-containing protein [Puia sp.]
MNFGLRLLICACLLTTAARAQKITYSTDDDSLAHIFKVIEIQGKCTIGRYDPDFVFAHVRFSIRDATPLQALDELQKEFPFKDSVASYSPLDIILERYHNTQLKGRVFNQRGDGMTGLTISLHGRPIASTDEKGYYALSGIADTDTLLVTGVGIAPQCVFPGGRIRMDIQIAERPDTLVTFTKEEKLYTDGYHALKSPHDPAASAYTLDSAGLARVPAFDITDILPGQVSGLLSGAGAGGTYNLAIHGTSTLFASRDPLFIIGPFPLDADPSVINLLDLEQINVLKDAPAAGPWGARSANGVFALTPRAGQITGDQTWISFDVNTTYTPLPDLQYNAGLDPLNYSALEQRLFPLGLYDPRLADPTHPPVSPIIETLDLQRRGLINASQTDALIRSYQQHSAADDLRRWFYQGSIRQQYHVGVTTGDSIRQHYYSFGVDKDNTSRTRNGLDRITFYDSYDQRIGAFQLGTRLNYTRMHKADNNFGRSVFNYPYADLGHPVNFYYPSAFTDTLGNGRLLPFPYIPTRELGLADNSITTHYLSAESRFRWDLSHLISAEFNGRYMYQPVITRRHYSKDGFYMRDLTNRLTDLSGPEPVYNIPIGDLLTEATDATQAYYLRGALSYAGPNDTSRPWCGVQLGFECSQVALRSTHQTLYGYDPRHNTSIPIDPQGWYPDLISGDLRQIPYDQSARDLYTRYQAFFGDLRLHWNEKLAFYLTAKWDGTNIVGVHTNRRFIPFVAIGFRRTLGGRVTDSLHPGAPFHLRASFGPNGNVASRNGYLVVQPLELNPYGAPQSAVASPPDPNLSWENIYTSNLGVDFNFFRSRRLPEGRIHGSLDVYYKFGVGILGNDSLQLSSGLNTFFGNTARLRGQGFDFVLNTENLFRPVRWTSRWLLSYFRDWVTRYPFEPASTSDYVTANIPRTGFPATALFSYRDTTLDPADGSPRGYLSGTPTRSYDGIVNGRDYSSITFSGSTQPSLFGSLLNTFTRGNWSLSFLITFKTGYVFRRASINYYSFTNLQDPGNKDYLGSWKKPGDERTTSVPAPPAGSNDYSRSLFYAYSASLVTRGDHVRLQDIRLSYDILKQHKNNDPIRLITAYLYIRQPCLIWKANHDGIDPEAYSPGALKPTPSFTMGLHIEL